MTKIGRALLLVLLMAVNSLAATVPDSRLGAKPSHKRWKAYFKAHKTVDRTLVRDPANQALALPSVKQNPWGGADAARWLPEAVLANAASAALNESSGDANVKDVLVAIPVKFQYSPARSPRRTERPKLSFGAGWNHIQPPLIVTLVQYVGGTERLKFRIDPALMGGAGSVRIVYHLRGAPTSKTWTNLKPQDDGSYEVTWAPTASEGPVWGGLLQNHVAFVQVGKSLDWFPVDFRDVVLSAGEMLEQLPESRRALGKGTPLDSESISVQGKDAPPAFPFLAMESESFGKDLNADRYISTGSGPHAVTLVMAKPPSSFTSAYMCLDKRDPMTEAIAGRPSGGGWRAIEAPAETVVNSLEADALLVGYANAQPAAATPSGGFAMGLADVAVVRMLRPGSALVAASGASTGSTYTWFAVPQPHEVCAIEWFHPAAPSAANHLGFESLWP